MAADLVTMSGYRAEADSQLATIMKGLAAFLDAYVIHFNERIKATAEWAPLSRYDGTGCKIFDYSALPESQWLLPVITGKA